VSQETLGQDILGVRASDADRDQAIGILNNGVAIGQLTAEEHAKRLQDALTAKTLSDLHQLTDDLRNPVRQQGWLSRRRGVVTVGLAGLLVVGTGVLMTNSLHMPPHLVSSPTTTRSSAQDGFVQPQPGVAGRFCQSMASNHTENPSGDPSGITPASNLIGRFTVQPGTSPSVLKDLAAYQALVAATHVVQQAWQGNGYQYPGITLTCLGDYSAGFTWVSATVSSTSPTTVSTAFTGHHSLLAARSATGSCWYVLNVMSTDDPIIQTDGLPSYGIFSAIGQGSHCSASASPGYGLWQQDDPLPPQLEGS
jgi:hypothetical protein